MPAWPTLFPLWLHFRREPLFPYGGGDSDMRNGNDIIANESHPKGLKGKDMYYRNNHISDHQFQMLYECEEERTVYKACMRKLLTLKKSIKHTSWETGDISGLYLT